MESITIRKVLVCGSVNHKEEYYASAKSTRDGVEIMATAYGGIEVESNWEEVKRILVDTGETPTNAQLSKWAKEAGFSGDPATKMGDFF